MFSHLVFTGGLKTGSANLYNSVLMPSLDEDMGHRAGTGILLEIWGMQPVRTWPVTAAGGTEGSAFAY